MAENLDHILKIIHRYVLELRRHGFNVTKTFLYGSFAKGHPHDDSDIDIGLVSEDFSGSWFDDRRKIIPLRREIDERLEPMPFRPEDFNMGSPMAAEIIAHGIEIELDELVRAN